MIGQGMSRAQPCQFLIGCSKFFNFQGEFGEVCRGKLIDGKKNVTVAIKRLRHGASLLDQTNFLREACTMAQFSDPNIVQFKGVVTKSRCLVCNFVF